jgi:hypothetical protein
MLECVVVWCVWPMQEPKCFFSFRIIGVRKFEVGSLYFFSKYLIVILEIFAILLHLDSQNVCKLEKEKIYQYLLSP